MECSRDLRLMNDYHSASAKGNLCNGVFHSIVPSRIAIFVTADQGVVSIFLSRYWVCTSAQYEQNVSIGIRSRVRANLIAGDCSFSSNPTIYLAVIFFLLSQVQSQRPAWCNPKPNSRHASNPMSNPLIRPAHNDRPSRVNLRAFIISIKSIFIFSSLRKKQVD